jgi:F-type H+-transporting ATPase subunit a
MPEQLFVTRILNQVFGGPVTSLLNWLQATLYVPVAPKYPEAPITNAVAMELLVFAFLIVVFLLVRSRLSVEKPGALQHMFEGIHGFVQNQSSEVIGHHSEVFTPFLVALGLFILLSNLLGLIPGLESPTGSPVVPLGCAVCAFIYYHAHGFRKHGIGYLKQFLGHQDPSMSMAIRLPISILMLLIEPISHLARVMSLTIRLYGNMFAGDMVILVFLSLIPIAVPIIFIALHIGVAFIQTYVFVLLTTVYLAGAVAEEH